MDYTIPGDDISFGWEKNKRVVFLKNVCKIIQNKEFYQSAFLPIIMHKEK